MLLLAVGVLGRSAAVGRPAAGTLSVSLDNEAHDASAIANDGRDKNVSRKKRADADLALRMAMKGGALQAIVIAIHATADIASLEVLDEARAMRARIRQDMREGNLQKAVEPPSPAAAADAALRTAIELRKLKGLMDAIHDNNGAASPELLDEAHALRDELRDEKHAAAGAKAEASASSKIDADAALRTAIELRKLKGLMDAIHDNNGAASPEVLDEARALRDELRDEKHTAAGEPPRDEKQAATGEEEKGAPKIPFPHSAPDEPWFNQSRAPSPSKLALVERLSDIFFNAVPSEDLSKVGLTIHCWDATEEIPREPWRPCGSGICAQFQKWWSASTINWANHYTFGDAGIIMEPERNSVLCSYAFDSGTMAGGCVSGRPENLTRVISQSMFWQHMGYNEILMNSSDFMAKLPGSIAAFVFNLKGEGHAGVTYQRYQQFLRHFNLSDADVPLLRANFNGGKYNGSWRTQKKEYSNPYKCGGGENLHTTFQSWMAGDCPPTLLGKKARKACEAEDSETCGPQEMPLFTDMTVHAREYLRVNSATPEELAPAWHTGRAFRVGANKEVPPDHERLRTMGQKEFERELKRNMKGRSAPA